MRRAFSHSRSRHVEPPERHHRRRVLRIDLERGVVLLHRQLGVALLLGDGADALIEPRQIARLAPLGQLVGHRAIERQRLVVARGREVQVGQRLDHRRDRRAPLWPAPRGTAAPRSVASASARTPRPARRRAACAPPPACARRAAPTDRPRDSNRRARAPASPAPAARRRASRRRRARAASAARPRPRCPRPTRCCRGGNAARRARLGESASSVAFCSVAARLVEIARAFVDARQRHERAHVRRIALEDALENLRRRLRILELLLPDVGRAHQERNLARRVALLRAPVGVLGQAHRSDR